MRAEMSCPFCVENGFYYKVSGSKRSDVNELMEGHIRKEHMDTKNGR